MKRLLFVCAGALLGLLSAIAVAAVSEVSDGSDRQQIDHGRYLVTIAGCNDCHTPGYMGSEGNVPEKDWLTGDALGWRGPWGTTYPSNLRLSLSKFTEEQWLTVAKTVEFRPPMPWFNLRHMSDSDLRAVYRYVRHLGPAGKPAPAWVPPEQTPSGPFVQLPAPPPQVAP